MDVEADQSTDFELDDEKGPERTCIVTREKSAPDQMIRFVIGPDGDVVPDIRARLPGRGAWVTGTAAVLALAMKRKAFTRAFKKEARVDQELVAQVDVLLEKDALQTLALVNKAGRVICGTAKIESALAGESVIGLIHATDGSPDGARKLLAVWRRSHPERPEGTRVQIFSSSQLDLALGRSNVIHAALIKDRVSDAFLTRVTRVELFRGSTQAESTGTLGVAALSER